MTPERSDATETKDRAKGRPPSNRTGPARGGGALPRWFWLGALLVAATLAAYWPAFSAGFVFDDEDYVTRNPLLTAPDGWSRIWFSAHAQSQYFPLVFSTLRIEYGLWGLWPAGYHAVNVGIHIINALLVWVLLRRLNLPGAWLAAAIFALHPVEVESVAWVTEMKNTESTMFYLLALLAWLNFSRGRGRGYYLLALALYLPALFAKTTACTLPAALVLVLWLARQPVGWRRIVQILPFLLLGFGLGLVTVWWEKHLGSFHPPVHLLGGPLDRLVIATHAVWFYAGKVFWPVPLIFSYPRWNIDSGDWRQYGWLLACLLAAAGLWLGRRRIGIGPLAAVIFFVAALSPMLGFIPLYTFYFTYVADHYQYLACAGLMALFAGLAAHWTGKIPGPHGRSVPMVLAALLLGGLGILTWRQCGIYRNPEVLWTDTVNKNPQSWMAHMNLGRQLALRQKYDEAEEHYRTSLAINPDEDSTHYNYANLLVHTGRLDEGIGQYRESLRLNPRRAEAHSNLGTVLKRQHRTDEAIAEYELAIRCQPDYADAYYNLGNALWEEKRLDEAVTAYRQAVQLNPDSELFRKRLQSVTGTAN